MPGPLLTVTIGESVKRGGVAGPLIIVGHAILEGTLVLLLLAGLSSLLVQKGFKIFSFLSGGVILLIMGALMVRDAKKVSLDDAASAESRGGNLVILGILGSLSNPYWIIWWATIGMGYLVASIKSGIPGVLSFFVGHILADFVWYSFVSFGLAKGKKLLSRRAYQGIILACGLFLVGFGGWFLLEGMKVTMS
ncbi:MAG: lysine transporter LysE [Deltaproteobacteria bacterium]|nr:MAG: lysine transporter LysE [Deltaproteobacteria bacterium]